MVELNYKPRVAMAWCDDGDASGWFAQSIFHLVAYDQLEAETPIMYPKPIRIHGGPLIARHRNSIVREFLRNLPDVDYLWFVDSDMIFDGDTPHRMLAAAEENDIPILSAFTLGLMHDGTPIATMSKKNPDNDDELMFVWPHTPDSLVKVDCVGTGCVLIRRDVFEVMADKMPNEHFPWFGEDVYKGLLRGEDQSFCLRAGECGFDVYVHTGIPVGHWKAVNVIPSIQGAA